MRVRRLTAWLGLEHPVAAGEVCDMPDDLAAIHIAHGGAEAVDAPADSELVGAAGVTEPLTEDASPPAASAEKVQRRPRR